MRMKAKYIVYHNTKWDNDDIVVFSQLQKHCDVARTLPGEPVGAGFIEISSVYDLHTDTRVVIRCYGESDSMNLKSREDEDTDIARIFLLGEV